MEGHKIGDHSLIHDRMHGKTIHEDMHNMNMHSDMHLGLLSKKSNTFGHNSNKNKR